MTIEERLNGKTTDEINNLIVELEKDLIVVNEGLSAKKKDKHILDLRRHEIEGQMKNLAILIDDLRDKKSRILIEIDICKSTYWARR